MGVSPLPGMHLFFIKNSFKIRLIGNIFNPTKKKQKQETTTTKKILLKSFLIFLLVIWGLSPRAPLCAHLPVLPCPLSSPVTPPPRRNSLLCLSIYSLEHDQIPSFALHFQLLFLTSIDLASWGCDLPWKTFLSTEVCWEPPTPTIARILCYCVNSYVNYLCLLWLHCSDCQDNTPCVHFLLKCLGTSRNENSK